MNFTTKFLRYHIPRTFAVGSSGVVPSSCLIRNQQDRGKFTNQEYEKIDIQKFSASINCQKDI